METGVETAGSERRYRDPHIRLGPNRGRKHGMTGLNMFQPTGSLASGSSLGMTFRCSVCCWFMAQCTFARVFRAVLPEYARNFPDEPPQLPSTDSRQLSQCESHHLLVKPKGGCRVIRRGDFVLQRSLENVERRCRFDFEAVSHGEFCNTRRSGARFAQRAGHYRTITVALCVKERIESTRNLAEILSSVCPGWISGCHR